MLPRCALNRYLINSDTATFREIVDFVRDKVRRPLLRFSMPKPLLLGAYYGGFIKSKVRILFSHRTRIVPAK
jgi:hypothetical protein